MKIFIILLTIINISAAHASENIFFSSIPSYVTTDEAITAVTQAALKRRWTTHELENNKLRIELDHRGYKAVLNFSFSEKEIHYSDSTTYFNDIFVDEDEDSKGEWEASPAPGNWVKNLKNDVNGYFAISKRNRSVKESFSHENAEKKLESLKILYDKKLITEAEYTLKKEEIMSRY